MKNPFENLQVERWNLEEAISRFVKPFAPVRAWEEISEPKSRILWGSWGTGKSILLKNASWPAMCQTTASQEIKYVGIYINLAKCDYLNSKFLLLNPEYDPAILYWFSVNRTNPLFCFSTFLAFGA